MFVYLRMLKLPIESANDIVVVPSTSRAVLGVTGTESMVGKVQSEFFCNTLCSR